MYLALVNSENNVFDITFLLWCCYTTVGPYSPCIHFVGDLGSPEQTRKVPPHTIPQHITGAFPLCFPTKQQLTRMSPQQIQSWQILLYNSHPLCSQSLSVQGISLLTLTTTTLLNNFWTCTGKRSCNVHYVRLTHHMGKVQNKSPVLPEVNWLESSKWLRTSFPFKGLI